MDYDVLVSYLIPILGIAILVAFLCVGIAILIAKIRGEKDVPTWVIVILGFGLLGSIAVIFVVGSLLGWDSPI